MRAFLAVVGAIVFLWLVNGVWSMTQLGPTGVVVCDTCAGHTVNVLRVRGDTSSLCKLPIGGEVQIIYRTGDMVRVKGYACTGYLPSDMVEVNE